MAMRLTVIGSSPAWPNPGKAHAGYVVESPGAGRLLLDCGPGVLGRLRATGLYPVSAIAITHLHLDHWGDLVPWIWMAKHTNSGSRPPVWVPPGATTQLRALGRHLGYEGMFEQTFELAEYEPRTAFPAAGFKVEAVPVEHYDMNAFGFRVSDDAGVLLAYSGDSGPCRALGELANGADLFLCEATLASGALDANPRGHLSADEALSYPTRRTVLTHRPEELGSPDGTRRVDDGVVIEIAGP
jgi:ribonuclease BN (tRNA processing enzyme)